ncbi:hypothetical protein GW17_00050926 [Ensete ventricosum]|nr:hypothetical protein GW17_00050926 [Ensete ventricosum]
MADSDPCDLAERERGRGATTATAPKGPRVFGFEAARGRDKGGWDEKGRETGVRKRKKTTTTMSSAVPSLLCEPP